MRKKIAILLIVNLIFSLFTIINISPEVYAGCCRKAGNDYCSPDIEEDDCDSGYYSSFSCSVLTVTPSCRSVCCLGASGRSISGVSEIQCISEGGTVLGEGICSGVSSPFLDVGGCLIGNQCVYPRTRAECDRLANGAPHELKTDVSSSDDCLNRYVYSRSIGCCIDPSRTPICSTTSSDECTTTGGGARFESGVCSTYSECREGCFGRGVETRCRGEDVWEYDACTNSPLRVVENCDSGNEANPTTCGTGASGRVECVLLNCKEGQRFFTGSGNVFDEAFAGGERNVNSVTITSEMLGGLSGGDGNTPNGRGALLEGGKAIRKHGESWCMLSASREEFESGGLKNSISYDREDGTLKIHEERTAGARYYVYRCENGRIISEPCSDFRAEICKSDRGSETGSPGKLVEHARCVDNQWEGCKNTGYLRRERDRCENAGDCYYETRGANECVPKYPPGMAHWDESLAAQNNAQCGRCGNGWNNPCDDNECWHFGDCGYKNRVWWKYTLGGGVAGAVIALAAYGALSVFGIVGESAAAGGAAGGLPESLVGAPPGGAGGAVGILEGAGAAGGGGVGKVLKYALQGANVVNAAAGTYFNVAQQTNGRTGLESDSAVAGVVEPGRYQVNQIAGQGTGHERVLLTDSYGAERGWVEVGGQNNYEER